MFGSQHRGVDPVVCSVASTLEMIGRPGRCESGDALSRLFLHFIDGKKCGVKNAACADRGRRRHHPRSNLHFFARHLFATKTISAVGLNRRSQSARREWTILLCSLRFLLFVHFFLRPTAHAWTCADKCRADDRLVVSFWCGFDLMVGSIPAPKQPEPWHEHGATESVFRSIETGSRSPGYACRSVSEHETPTKV